MPNKIANPGALPGTEIVGIGSLFGGWISQPTGNNGGVHLSASIEGRQGLLERQSQNQYAESDGITLFRLEKFGHIAPGQIFTAVTDASAYVTDLPLNGGLDVNGSAWIVLRNGRLIQTVSSPTAIGAVTAKYDPAMSGIHSTHTLNSPGGTEDADIIILYDLASPPVQWTLWAWEDNTDADISIIKNSGASENDAWYSGLTDAYTNVGLNANKSLKKGVPHKMCQGPDGNLYITNGSYVEQIIINGGLTDASLTKRGLELPLGTGWTATGIVSYKNYVAIIASSTPTSVQRGQTSLFLWTGISSTVNGVTSIAAQYIFPLPDNFGNGIFFDGDILYALTNGRNNSSKIFEFTGKGFKKVFESALIGTSAAAIQGSMESYQDSLMIGGKRNSQACLFRFYAGGFHNEGAITDGTNIATSAGMVKNLYTNALTIGINYSTTYKLYTQTTFSKYQTGAVLKTILFTEGILGRRLYPLGFKGTVNRIQIFLSQWGTGASLTLSLYKDYGTTDLLTSRVLDTTAYPIGTTEIDIIDFALVDISSFYMTITFSHASVSNTAAIIRRMLVHWMPSQ